MGKKIKNNRPVLSSTSTKTEQTVTQIKASSFIGPLPHPSALKEYDSVLPGLAGRIVFMAEAEAKHRHGMDNEMARMNLSSKENLLNGVLGKSSDCA